MQLFSSGVHLLQHEESRLETEIRRVPPSFQPDRLAFVGAASRDLIVEPAAADPEAPAPAAPLASKSSQDQHLELAIGAGASVLPNHGDDRTGTAAAAPLPPGPAATSPSAPVPALPNEPAAVASADREQSLESIFVTEFHLTRGASKNADLHRTYGHVQTGRPDLMRVFARCHNAVVRKRGTGRVAVLVCGPESMVREAAMLCNQMSGSAVQFDLQAEAFGI